jgi:hypothetical protein
MRSEPDAISRIKHCSEQEWEVGSTQISRFTDDVKVLLAEYERLRRVEEDFGNVLKAALYLEKDGVDLANRLTAYAIRERTPEMK